MYFFHASMQIKSSCKEEIKMQLGAWSIVTIVITVIGFFGGIWYEHK